MASNGQRYTEEFKADTIRMIKEGGRSVNSVAKDLGVNPQTVRNWLGKYKSSQDPDKLRIAQLEAELKAERRKSADLEESVAILKKATAIFAINNRK
jgi:transposase